MLERANPELRCDFSIPRFQHRAVFNPERSRIDMGLVSRLAQSVRLDGEASRFENGEVPTQVYSYTCDVVR